MRLSDLRQKYNFDRKLVLAFFVPSSIVKIALGRTMWNIIDVIVAVLLIICFFLEKNTRDL
ncbi:MAG: hypothetical protein K5778_10485 [Bacteroidaceae bacterium]|nr:hypothetical protein [Bacteroidaceae bacterium]